MFFIIVLFIYYYNRSVSVTGPVVANIKTGDKKLGRFKIERPVCVAVADSFCDGFAITGRSRCGGAKRQVRQSRPLRLSFYYNSRIYMSVSPVRYSLGNLPLFFF